MENIKIYKLFPCCRMQIDVANLTGAILQYSVEICQRRKTSIMRIGNFSEYILNFQQLSYVFMMLIISKMLITFLSCMSSRKDKQDKQMNSYAMLIPDTNSIFIKKLLTCHAIRKAHNILGSELSQICQLISKVLC